MKKLLMLVVTLMLGATLAVAQGNSSGSTQSAAPATKTAKKSTKKAASPKAKTTKKDTKAKKDTTPAK